MNFSSAARSFSVLLLAGLGALAGQPDAANDATVCLPRARAIRCEVSQSGQLLMHASLSDDGQPDADAVWGRLDGLHFETTPAFDALCLAELKRAERPDTDRDALRELTLRRPSADADASIVIQLRYGGTATLHSLELRRGTPDRWGRCWQVKPGTAARWFAHRSITRRQAALLKDQRLPQ